MSCCGNKPDPKKPESPDALDLMQKDFRKTQKPTCCSTPKKKEEHGDCCGSKGKIDYILWGSLIACGLAVIAHLFFSSLLPHALHTFAHSIYELLLKMWWGLALGIIAVGLLGNIPRAYIQTLLGKGGTMNGILRATGAGLLLDLCNHGILLVAMKLYERGASLGQTLAFIIASPWNSLSLTLILIGLIGIKWTIAFVLLSGLIAITTGYIADILVRKGKVQANPNSTPIPEDFNFWRDAKQALRHTKFNRRFYTQVFSDGLRGSTSIIRWILFGTVLAAGIRAFVDPTIFTTWFGPSMLGVGMTLLAATIIEVCSEGSSPIAADLVTRANAPGNGFAFLMAGAATDYTEIMALKETTKSWKTTFILPILTLPQVTAIAIILNQFS
ncbi:permease [Rubritalea sp.]|uniref:permease n=1 Tax=Rubritalea sp. TaxID=2109375 RepID=UPI003EF21556